jgi:predicted transcriptional regulator of viral defense system
MRIEEVIRRLGGLPFFDLPMVAQSTDEGRSALRAQLSRWMKEGKLLGLRRGFYTLADDLRRVPLVPVMLANELYHPSYLSGLWALGYYDLIPERVVWYTSVTPRAPRRFENAVGIYEYRHVKQSLFFGYRTVDVAGHAVLGAEPEKALLDHWHLSPGEWTPVRIQEMRYQNASRISADRLRAYAVRFQSPRLMRAVDHWLALAKTLEDGTVNL